MFLAESLNWNAEINEVMDLTALTAGATKKWRLRNTAFYHLDPYPGGLPLCGSETCLENDTLSQQDVAQSAEPDNGAGIFLHVSFPFR